MDIPGQRRQIQERWWSRIPCGKGQDCQLQFQKAWRGVNIDVHYSFAGVLGSIGVQLRHKHAVWGHMEVCWIWEQGGFLNSSLKGVAGPGMIYEQRIIDEPQIDTRC